MPVEDSTKKQNEECQSEKRMFNHQKNTKVTQQILIISKLLEELIEAEGFDCHSPFNSEKVPLVTLQHYLSRIHKYTKFSPSCLIIAVIYLDRYNMVNEDFVLNKFNVHRFFLTCLIVAVKYHDDFYFDNLTFEKVGGVPVSELLMLELELLEKLEFKCHIDCEEYKELEQKLCSIYKTVQM